LFPSLVCTWAKVPGRMGNSGSAPAEDDVEAQIARGAAESKHAPPSQSSTPHNTLTDSESEEEKLDASEISRRKNLDMKDYAYDPEQVEELIMLSGSTSPWLVLARDLCFGSTPPHSGAQCVCVLFVCTLSQ